MSASDFNYRAETGDGPLGYLGLSARKVALPWPVVVLVVALADAVLVGALATAIGHAYYIHTYNDPTNLDTHVRLGSMMALVTVAMCAVTGGYHLDRMARRRFRPAQLAWAFLLGVLMLVALLFLMKVSEDYSRSVVSISFAAGLPLILLLRYAELRVLRRMSRAGLLESRRIILIGDPARTAEIARDGRVHQLGYDVLGRFDLAGRPGEPCFDAQLAVIAEQAARLDPDGIVIALPWADRAAIRTAVEGCVTLRAAVFLDGDPYLRELAGSTDTAFGSPIGIQVVSRPLSQTHLALKRSFDIAVSTLALLMLAPVMAIVATLVRIDSRGPVIFRQKRYGYNREPFHIYKFRTMRHEAGSAFRQASRNDARVTRIGRLLRKTNLDELPQLFNVLAGDMSLVGPRPHPIELDDRFSPLIHHYARRHRVRPGITGWAQVNGLRGETDTTEKMSSRVAYDLQYLNNWSFGLDIRILVMTVLSIGAYRNAF